MLIAFSFILGVYLFAGLLLTAFLLGMPDLQDAFEDDPPSFMFRLLVFLTLPWVLLLVLVAGSGPEETVWEVFKEGIKRIFYPLFGRDLR